MSAINTGIFDRLIVKSSLKYRLMFIAGGFVHLTFLIIFFVKGIMPLAVFNIFSLVVYILGTVFGINRKTGNMRFGFLLAFYGEILVHSVLCTLLIGVETDFQLYAVVILPVAVYVLFFSCNMEKFTITISALAILCVAGLVTSNIVVQNVELLPMYPLTYDERDMFRAINLIFSGVMLVTFSMIFALELYHLLNQQKAVTRKLEYTASHDALTGLYNRHSLKPLFEELESNNEHFCVALGDIDDFKKVNDTYGHDGGDAVLKMVSGIISEHLCENELACRWGGEEILVILRGSREDCHQRVSEIHRIIGEGKAVSEGNNISVTMTFGFAEMNSEETVESLISLADKRLYHGKKNGKDVVVSK